MHHGGCDAQGRAPRTPSADAICRWRCRHCRRCWRCCRPQERQRARRPLLLPWLLLCATTTKRCCCRVARGGRLPRVAFGRRRCATRGGALGGIESHLSSPRLLSPGAQVRSRVHGGVWKEGCERQLTAPSALESWIHNGAAHSTPRAHGRARKIRSQARRPAPSIAIHSPDLHTALEGGWGPPGACCRSNLKPARSG